MKQILVIEDCENAFYLIQKAISCLASITWARSMAEAKILINTSSFDLLILDVELPDGSGFDLCSELRKLAIFDNLPIFLLTAIDDIEAKCKGFAAGADDYLTKPFDHRELKARIERRLRAIATNSIGGLLKIGSMLVNQDMQRVHTEQGIVDLTSTEFKILMLLAKQAGEVCDRETISQKVWDNDDANVRQVDTHVSKLRKKIGADKILSIHGRGYKLAA